MEGRERRRLQRWYGEHGRHGLPWRLTRDPYAVLVSEVMLQQTQVERVIPYYVTWLERWPDATALASAPVADVIRVWDGLGYNRRAVQLHRASTVIVERHGGVVPTERSILVALPGIGPYTAAAVACFASERREVVLDTNIVRVVARARLGVADARATTPRELREAAEAILPRRSARAHNLALMDVGAIVCRPLAPACACCPLRQGCAWRQAGHPPTPVAGSPKRSARFEDTSRFARGQILRHLRSHGQLPLDEIEALLPAAHRGRCAEYLAGLERDGLVVHERGIWGLP